MAKLKRFEPHQMLELLARFGSRWSKLRVEGTVSADFLVVPRYDACIRMSTSAVDFFFSHIHRIDSIRTQIFRSLLKVACRSRVVRRAFLKSGIISRVINTSSCRGVDWTKVDVLLAEWHFVGVFSQEVDEVAHILGFPEFMGRLERELGARKAIRGIIDVPEVKKVFMEEPAGWIESIVGGLNGQQVATKDYQRAQEKILTVYQRTSRKVDATSYVDDLMNRARKRYFDGKGRVLPVLTDLEVRARELIEESNISWFTLARTHGDLKPSQVLLDGSKIYLIDWTESGYTWMVHDLVDLMMNSYSTFDLSTPSIPAELRPLFEGLQTECARAPGPLPFVITLMEIAVRQHVVFQKGRGPIQRWERNARKILSATAVQ